MPTAELHRRLQAALRGDVSPQSRGASICGERLRKLAGDGLADLPLPGKGETIARWRALSTVAAHDLALAKLYEGHTDALAILAEAGDASFEDAWIWGMWAAEPPGARVVFEDIGLGRCTITGIKAWCSGAQVVDAGLLTAWRSDGSGPYLVAVELDQPGVSFDDAPWQSVGMHNSGSVDVHFEHVPARLIGGARFYLDRAGFWHGGIGVAACWHGGACAVADALRSQAMSAGERAGWHRWLALGEVDGFLAANAALLREAAAWIDTHPDGDAQSWALRTRTSSDFTSRRVLELTTRALGAGPLCRDARFARLAADLPVFIRQCHGDRDLAALGQRIAGGEEATWLL